MKRRFWTVLILLAVLFSCALTVSADSAASGIRNFTNINVSGEAQVSVQVNIRLENQINSMTFPVPETAMEIRLNGGSCRVTKKDGVALVDISEVVKERMGEVQFSISYVLPNVVTVETETVEKEERDRQTVQLPLLSGFSLPVENMDFTVTLPAKAVNAPAFVGGYLQHSIESSMESVVHDNMITGNLTASLQDHETMYMTLDAGENMFQTRKVYERTGNPELVPMGIFAALALLYWLVFLRNLPVFPSRCVTPPQGLTAGELGSRLTFSGLDVTMMVFSWAQMGYILIYKDESGRVVLNKRMDMGNERSGFEIKIFNSLFGRRRMVDGTGYPYAKLCQKYDRQNPGQRSVCNPKSGNEKIFRLLSCGTALFAGVCIAMNMVSVMAMRIVLSIVLGAFAAFSGWHIQQGMKYIHLQGKVRLWIGLGLCGFWLLLGLVTGQSSIALLLIGSQLLAGLAAAYGGRRNELGRQNCSDILSLRNYLKKIPREDILLNRKNDPDYFFNMLPYAMALGVGKPFAKAFGKMQMNPCPYLVTEFSGRQTAAEWYQSVQETARVLEARHKKLMLEKLSPVRLR